MIFRGGLFWQISIVLLVLTWAIFKLRAYRLSRSEERPPLEKMERYEGGSRGIRTLSWFVWVLIPLPFLWLFPEISIITRDYARAKVERSHVSYYNPTNSEIFFFDHYYVLFCYKGIKCSPCKKYLCNESDSTLVVYPVSYDNGHFCEISENETKTIQPHTFIQCDININHKFTQPIEHCWIYYCQEKYKNAIVTEWTIDTKSDAAIRIKMVNAAVDNSNRLFRSVFSPGTNDFFKVKKDVDNILKEVEIIEKNNNYMDKLTEDAIDVDDIMKKWEQ